MKLSIFTRLIISYLAIILLIICLGIYAILSLNHVNQDMDYIISVDSATVRLITELTDTIFIQLGFEEKYFVLRDEDFHKHFWKAEDSFRKDIGKLQNIADTSQKRMLVKGIQDAYNLYTSLFKKESSFPARNPNKGHYKIYRKKRGQLIDEINQKLKELARMADLDREKKTQAAGAITNQVVKVTTATVGIAILMVIFISVLNTRSINHPILLLKEKTKEVAKGRYPQSLNITSPPEIMDLAMAFDSMCERLRELDDMKRDFISHVSHKLRTPLTAIQEASSMLLDGVFTGAPEKEHELFSIIKEECKRLINEVNRILDLSRMEAGMMDYHFETSSIIPIIRKIVLKLTPLAQKKGVDFEMNLKDEDQERITQVVEELLGNALKFTAGGGKITISAVTTKNGMLEVSVADTGCGIPEKELERVFDKFKRIEGGRAAARGTGLGLSIAKHIISVHGGQIWAGSKPEKGSTFSFTLPVS
ncbi:MAG TPA: HAMP domain-containing sensor histidine kinase [Thermodesulfobacteriota bacterium]|nr:HAMP domain-containing sensor histidine kinase [Thermodesulfobacteriota bacterium]